MKKSTILLLVSIIGFIVSAVFTIIWFTSDTSSVFSIAFMLSFGMALVFEVMKITSGVLAFVEKWLPMPARIILGIISVSLFLYSVLASSGYLTNTSNKNKNQELKSSIPYLQSIEAREAKKQRLAAIDKEKENIIARKSEISSEGEKIINSMPKNYIDRKNQQRNATQKSIDKVQEQYNNLAAEQSKLTSELQNVIDMSNIKVMSEKGSSSISSLIANFMNNIDTDTSTPYTTEGVEMFLKIFASILFEIIAWTAAVLYPIAKMAEGSNYDLSSTPKSKKQFNSSIGYNPDNLVTARKQDEKNNENTIKSNLEEDEKPLRMEGQELEAKRKIGFVGNGSKEKELDLQTLPEHIDNETVRAYVKRMCKNKTIGDVVDGYKQISKDINISATQGYKILGYLSNNNYINATPAGTILLKNINQIK